MPESLQDSIKNKERPLPAVRREMIRILADDISKTLGRPTRSQLAAVASKVVSEYPKSFQDNLDDAIVGTGYNSLLTQLEHRLQNINKTVKPTKRPNSLNSLDSNKSKKHKSGISTSSYGTIAAEYQPELPEEEDESTQDSKKEALKDIHSSDVWNLEDLNGYLDETYPTVRLLINEGSQSITTLKKEWPFLFEKVGILHHFERLVGIEVQETLSAALTSKVPRIMQFMNAKQTTSKPLRKILKEIEAAKCKDGTNNPDIIGLLVLLATFFGEDTREFIHVEEETSLEADIDKDTLPVTPCIIALGTSAMTSKCFMLTIDREIVNCNISSPLEAVCMLFASFFVFNIEYAKKAVATLEFVQRCLVRINPATGSKMKKTWRGSANPKVLSLINSLKDFESDWS